ncbi:MAG: OFA family MFS transporter [Clostridiales bacterium]|nr:OFA family MFS transporter [Clostridiales bacterium]
MNKKVLMFLFTLITMLCLGLVYGWSVFVVPLEGEFGWLRSETSLTFTISIIAMCLGMMAGGQFNKNRDKAFISLFISAVLLFIGFAMASRGSQLIHFYIFYGVCCGFGIGFAYVEMIAIATKWFPGKQGLTSGVLMMCFGLGAMILGTICSGLMDSIGWRTTFLALGFIFGILVLLDGIMLQTTVKQRPEVKAFDDKEKNASSYVRMSVGSHESMTSKEMVKSGDFKMLYIWHIFVSAAGLALMGHIAPCAMQIGVTAATAALIAGAVSVSNGLGRIVYGLLYDRLGVMRTQLIINCIFIVATIVTAIAVTAGSIPILVAGCILVGMSFGAAPTSSSAVVNKLYGSRYFSANFGIVSTQLIFAAIIGPFLAGKLYNMTGNYVTTFYGVIGLGVAAMLSALAMLKIAKSNGREL